jgi:purine-nucleoside phosphorylase
MIPLPFEKSADYISTRLGNVHHDVAIVLGSGLGKFTKRLTNKIVLRTREIPAFPASTVPGHAGEIVSAYVADMKALIFSGRVHYYETGSAIDAAAPAIVSHHLGIRKIVLTNAAGILNTQFSPAELMLIRDQVNLTFRNVLHDLKIPMTNLHPIYSERLMALAFVAAENSGVNLRSGIYVGLTGPAYETPSEVKFCRIIGGDAAGMSTIHEALFARSVGMEITGISCLTNYSTGITLEKLSHEEVTKISALVMEKFSRLLKRFVELL